MKDITKPAWAGELMLLEAKWTDKDGHTAKFKLVTPNEERPNPFKAFTKRRGGKAGSRFYAAMALIDGLATDRSYNGEVMLAGWADTSTQGYTVTFWVEPPDEGLHPFEGYKRGVSSFMCVLVDQEESEETTAGRAITEESDAGPGETKEQAADPAFEDVLLCGCSPEDQEGCSTARRSSLKAEITCRMTTSEQISTVSDMPATPAIPATRRQRTLAQYAAMLCANPEFWKWCNEHKPDESYETVFTKEDAAVWMRKYLGVDSRRDIDLVQGKATLYHTLIRKPFVEWGEVA